MKGVSLKLGTRGSKLALWQATWVKERLQNRNPGLQIEIVAIATYGDRNQSQPLEQMGQTGVFVKEIERALRDGTIDFAVHSAKDLPSKILPEFELMAFTEREDPRDVLLAKNGYILKNLPKAALLATGSLRRKAQLLAYRPDFRFENLRGNIDTRVRKFLEADWDGIVVAWAGIKRMGFRRYVSDFIPTEVCLPAVGQGAIALEGRKGDRGVKVILETISDERTEKSVRAERAFLLKIEAGCHSPVGALGQINQNELLLKGVVASGDGKRVLREEIVGNPSDPESCGEALAEQMIRCGAREILVEDEGKN